MGSPLCAELIIKTYAQGESTYNPARFLDGLDIAREEQSKTGLLFFMAIPM